MRNIIIKAMIGWSGGLLIGIILILLLLGFIWVTERIL